MPRQKNYNHQAAEPAEPGKRGLQRGNLRTERQLLPESVTKLNLMRMRAAYECGRDATTKYFVWPAKIMEYLKWFSTAQPDSRAGLIDFYHYMEALVAFHRYLGGSEN